MRAQTFVLVIMSVTAITLSALLGLHGVPAAPPSILLTPARVSEMKSNFSSDPDYQSLISFLDRQFDARNFSNDMRGAAPLAQARRVQWEILIGSVLWKVKGDDDAASKAVAALRAGAKLPVFKDDDYAATSELMAGLALGYDLFYDRLSDAERKDIVAKLGGSFRWAKRQKSNRAYWTTINENGASVSNASLLLASVVAPTSDPDAKGQRSLFRDQASLLRSAYGSTGGSAEGVMYWNYVVYSVLLAETAAKDAGQPVSSSESILAKLSPSFPTYVYGPTGQAFNYGDSFEGAIPAPISFTSSNAGDHYWYRKYVADGIRDGGNGWFWQEYRYLALAAILWDRDGSASDLNSMPLDRLFSSTDVVGTMHESFTNPNAAFVAYRGGSSAGVHNQLDMGSFIYEVDGVRWIVDPGQDAAKDDYYDKTKGGRWNWLRTSSEGHSLLLTSNGGSKPNREAPSMDFSAGGTSPFGSLNLGSAYGIGDYNRVFQLQDRRTLQVKDQIGSGMSGGGKWQAITKARVTASGATATMTQAGKSATLTVVEPSGARVRAERLSAGGKKVNTPVDGLTAISFDVPAGTKRVIVRISPG
jgi:hypothetical protein